MFVYCKQRRGIEWSGQTIFGSRRTKRGREKEEVAAKRRRVTKRKKGRRARGKKKDA